MELPGFGPPPGSITVPLEDFAKRYGNPIPPNIVKDDPAFQPPRDPLDASTRSKASLVYRDIPVIQIQNSWTVEQARGALYAHMAGIFSSSTQLFESILGDDRVMATLGSRISGLFGREVRFNVANDSDAAKECMRAWRDWWPRFSGGSSLTINQKYKIGMGFSASQVVWDTSGPVWGPYLRPWNPQFMYYHWPTLKFRALSQDGEIEINPGDGKWVLFGKEYRSFIFGAIRAIAEPWMLRHFAFRDMARFSEVHGMPTRVGKVPAVSDPEERAAFESAISQLGFDTSMILPQGVDGPTGSGYEYQLVEARDTAWESFGAMIDRCDMAIVLALLFQNLTTEVSTGSFAATSAHMDIRQSGLQGDNAELRDAIYEQVARPFAWINFGDADLAPKTEWDVEPRADLEGNAKQFQAFSTSVEVLARGGVKFTDVEELRSFAAKKFGLDGLPKFDIGDPPSSGGGGFGK